MTIPINGMCHVSAERAAAYEDAIENGYRVATPATDPVAEAVSGGVPAAAGRPVPDDTGRLTGLMAEHLALHNEYLDHQLQTGQRMAGLLERAAEQGTLGDVVAGVSAAKEHSLAMGRAHLKASEVLRDLARLEVGATAPARREPEETSSASATAARLSAVPPVPANVEIVQVEQVERASSVEGAPAVAEPAKAAAGEEVAAALVGVVAEKTGYPAGMIDLDMGLESDLGVDSIKRVEIVGALRERLSVGVGVRAGGVR